MQVLAHLLKKQSHSRHYYLIASKIWRAKGGKCKPLIMHSPWIVSFYSNSRKGMDNWTERCMERNIPFKTACSRWLKIRTVLLKRFYSYKQFKYLHTYFPNFPEFLVLLNSKYWNCKLFLRCSIALRILRIKALAVRIGHPNNSVSHF